MGVKVTGMDEVRDMIQSMIDACDTAPEEVMGKFAEVVKDRLVSNIESQALNVAPLSKRYAEKKRRLGQDPRTLIRTHHYLSSLFTQGTSTGFIISVDADLGDLPLKLEYGTSLMPARPHWRPVIRWAEGEWHSVVKQFGEHLFKGL